MLRTILKSLVLVALPLPVYASAGTMNVLETNVSNMTTPATAYMESENLSIVTTERDLSEWLEAQGSSSTYFPPIGDYVGWTDKTFKIFALVDYAGVANRDLPLANDQYQGSLDTEVTGVVIERELSDGTALVTVDTWTKNALGFAQSIKALRQNGFDFANTETIFGNKVVDVANGGAPALGSARLRVSFSIPASGGPLPDLVNVLDDICNFVPFEVNFESLTYGTRPDGTKALMRVEQEGALEIEKEKCVPGKSSVSYKKEIIEIKNIVE